MMSIATMDRLSLSQKLNTRFSSFSPRRHFHQLRAGKDALYEVESIKGIHVVPGSDYENPDLEYLVEWKDNKTKTWEPKINLSPDLIRDFDDTWWTACANMDVDLLSEMIHHGGAVLSQVIDENGRTALHFCAARGRADLCQLLLDQGADPNFPDKDGYSPLHMASGYLQTHIVTLFLKHGANSQIPDDQGRTPLSLLEDLRDNLPVENPNALARRMALEQVIATLINDTYETLQPVAVLDVRVINSEKEYLIQWPDDCEDSWVPEKDVAEDVRDDFESGLEYAEAEAILDRKIRKGERYYLVRWKDDYEDSWEIEDNLASELVEAWEKENPMPTLTSSSRSPAMAR